MSVNERIRQFREAKHRNPTQFGADIGVPRTTLLGWEGGKTVPIETLGKIRRAYPDLNVDWLLSGTGEMCNSSTFDVAEEAEDSSTLPAIEEPPQPGPLGIPIIKGGLSEGTRTVIELGVPPDEMSGARLEGAHSLEMNGPAMGEELVYVDFYSSQTAGAGPAREVEAYQSTTPQAILLKFINPWRPDQVKALEVRGDSMTKIGLFDRDIVLFVPTEREGDGVFVISIENRLQVKRLEFDLLGETLRIISENDRYEPRVLTSVDEITRVKIEGKVVGWLHRHPY